MPWRRLPWTARSMSVSSRTGASTSASWSRTPAPASPWRYRSASSTRSSPPSRGARGWDCPSRARSSRPIAAVSWSRATAYRRRPSSSSFPPRPRFSPSERARERAHPHHGRRRRPGLRHPRGADPPGLRGGGGAHGGGAPGQAQGRVLRPDPPRRAPPGHGRSGRYPALPRSGARNADHRHDGDRHAADRHECHHARRGRLQQQVKVLREGQAAGGFEELIGKSESLKRVIDMAQRAAPTDLTVLIHGESGTGKELMARALHRLSARKDGPLIPVNCAALPEGLLESELFGHERGAFTGAIRARPGRFELAHDGTLFLDEIGDMPVAMQAKILRVLQERQFERVGGTRSIGADVRVIAATHQDLEAMAAEGRFRSVLFYRLQGVRLVMPPLRERIDDLPLLVTHLLERAAQRLWRQPATVSTEALRSLWTYPWPGNIRELQHVLEGAMVLSDGVILPEHLPPSGPRGAKTAAAGDAAPVVTGSLDEALEEWERRAILDALQKAHGVQARAAKILGITERSLWYRVKKLKIQVRMTGDNPDLA